MIFLSPSPTPPPAPIPRRGHLPYCIAHSFRTKREQVGEENSSCRRRAPARVSDSSVATLGWVPVPGPSKTCISYIGAGAGGPRGYGERNITKHIKTSRRMKGGLKRPSLKEPSLGHWGQAGWREVHDSAFQKLRTLALAPRCGINDECCVHSFLPPARYDERRVERAAASYIFFSHRLVREDLGLFMLTALVGQTPGRSFPQN